jgi:hypothetical protein
VQGSQQPRDAGWWSDIFFVTVILTTASGFILPAPGFTPALGLGIISTVVILAVLMARYRFALAGTWRWVRAMGLMLSFYFDAFVLVTQLFTKVPALMRTAPVPGAAKAQAWSGRRRQDLALPDEGIGTSLAEVPVAQLDRVLALEPGSILLVIFPAGVGQNQGVLNKGGGLQQEVCSVVRLPARFTVLRAERAALPLPLELGRPPVALCVLVVGRG